MGPITDTHYLHLKDAGWNEKFAAALLIIAILVIGLAPFWLTDLIGSGTDAIMSKILVIVK